MKGDSAPLSVESDAFGPYGRVRKKFDFIRAKQHVAESVPMPEEGMIHVASDKTVLEGLKAFPEIRNEYFGGLPIQLGYRCGKNASVTHFEYHRTTELLIAVTGFVIVVGDARKLRGDFDPSLIEVFFLPASTVVELYGHTLHSLPCMIEAAGFKTIVASPAGTGEPLDAAAIDKEPFEDTRLLEARNTWRVRPPDFIIRCGFGAEAG